MPFTDPLELFRAAVDAYIAGDYLGVARLADPVSLRVHKRLMLYFYGVRVQPQVLTAEDILQSSPEMPRAVAEYQASQHQQLADPAAQLERELPGVSSLDALRSLDAAQVFAASLDGRSYRRQIERLVAEGHATREAVVSAEQFHALHFPFVPLGVVEDGPHVAYVVYRQEPVEEETEASELPEAIAALPDDEQQLERELNGRGLPRLLRCRRQLDGGWLFYADYDFFSPGSVSIDPIEASDADHESGGEP